MASFFSVSAVSEYSNSPIDRSGPGLYVARMENAESHRDGRANVDQREIVDGFLAAAVKMEDQISKGVYEDYMDRTHWPAHLDGRVFLQIMERLTPLVEDTKNHRRILQALIQEHAKNP